MIIRKVTDDEYLESKKISVVAFEAPEKLPETNAELVKMAEQDPKAPAEQHWRERYAAFDDDGKMMASMAVIPFTAYFDGKELSINGIGDVSTLPHCRRGGSIRGCFAAALEDMFKKGDIFSYLYPFSYYFYRKFGYEQACDTVIWKVDLKGLPKSNIDGRIEMFEPGCDMSGFKNAYCGFAKNINMMLKRDEVLWKRRVTSFSPYESKQWSFVWYSTEGNAEGYMTYQSDVINGERIMTLRDFTFVSLPSLYAMLSFLSSFSSQYRYATIPLPAHISLTGVIPELAFEQVEKTVKFTGMLRVVNVKKALKNAAYKGEGSFVISVTDENLPQNTGFYSVTFAKSGIKVVITDEEPDIETDIQNFAKLISGALSLDECAYMPKIKIYGNRENLEKAFYKKPLWINDYF